MESVILTLMLMSLFGWIGYSIPANQEEKRMGTILGFLLGPIGLVIVAIMNR